MYDATGSSQKHHLNISDTFLRRIGKVRYYDSVDNIVILEYIQDINCMEKGDIHFLRITNTLNLSIYRQSKKSEH